MPDATHLTTDGRTRTSSEERMTDAETPGRHVDLTTDLTCLIKKQIARAAEIDGEAEFAECAGRLGADVELVDDADSTTETRQERIRHAHHQYFIDLASSPSTINSWLPPRLWGGMDTLRLAAKALGRSIYVVSQTQTVGLYHFRPGQLKRAGGTFLSAGIFVRDLKGWLLQIAADIEAQRQPLLLLFTPGHYEALLPTTPVSERKRALTEWQELGYLALQLTDDAVLPRPADMRDYLVTFPWGSYQSTPSAL
ncbi:hypothetical protein P43SY_006189 [Pythium insidiosum]|uniref:Uncharacterized protein n=1 Tax=Pythium insidiosum TaxID=114742 RepID=A0AAD5L7T9_PYTIN|nr:hypothetical protein P43SY_006189 [Pythium insidiosum]